MVNYEPGQDRNVAALNILIMCGGFLLYMTNQEKYMSLALKEARKALKIDEVPIGCVIVKDDKIIARGYNHRESKNDVTSHAEIETIRKANRKLKSWRLVDCDIYVTMEPCIMCLGAIYQSHIRHIYYGCLDLKGGAITSSLNYQDIKNINHYPEVTGGILEEQCSSIIKEYFSNKRKLKKEKTNNESK